jgi:hypothetical protein
MSGIHDETRIADESALSATLDYLRDRMHP